MENQTTWTVRWFQTLHGVVEMDFVTYAAAADFWNALSPDAQVSITKDM